MGEAKKRGSFEQRKTEALLREKAEREAEKARIEAEIADIKRRFTELPVMAKKRILALQGFAAMLEIYSKGPFRR